MGSRRRHPEAAALAVRGLVRTAWQVEGYALEKLAVFAARSGSEFDALEVAALLVISPRAAQQRLDLAVTLATRLPRTLAAVKAGRLDPYRPSKIADATLPLSLEAAPIVEEEILDRVEDMPAVKLVRVLRRIVARVNADALQALHEKRMAQRRVDMYPTEDGCAVLTVHGSAARVQVAAKRVDAIAYQLRDTGGADGRTMDQLRSDVALDLLAGKDFEHAKIIVQVTLRPGPRWWCEPSWSSVLDLGASRESLRSSDGTWVTRRPGVDRHGGPKWTATVGSEMVRAQRNESSRPGPCRSGTPFRRSR
ncbi:DUF222 domain-containing protein [Actinophytocola sp.]|uniref:DUF222 domain-containing protein n=1 Tax=Actinophytocola sp. TaxID=1872138 RepID=UPI0025BC3BF9|nr:DUF222 domain-containing protein [Actinophytocola sp.]